MILYFLVALSCDGIGKSLHELTSSTTINNWLWASRVRKLLGQLQLQQYVPRLSLHSASSAVRQWVTIIQRYCLSMEHLSPIFPHCMRRMTL